jgi:hypothetical protein
MRNRPTGKEESAIAGGINPNRREMLLASTALAAASTVGPIGAAQMAQAQPPAPPAAKRPVNIIYFLADNIGFGELGCYGGGILRGADTRRLDAFAGEGMKLLNFAPEAQCTPSRSALMTGRYAVRSGNYTVALPGDDGGLIAWEQTMGDVLCLITGTRRHVLGNGISAHPMGAGQPTTALTSGTAYRAPGMKTFGRKIPGTTQNAMA